MLWWASHQSILSFRVSPVLAIIPHNASTREIHFTRNTPQELARFVIGISLPPVAWKEIVTKPERWKFYLNKWHKVGVKFNETRYGKIGQKISAAFEFEHMMRAQMREFFHPSILIEN